MPMTFDDSSSRGSWCDMCGAFLYGSFKRGGEGALICYKCVTRFKEQRAAERSEEKAAGRAFLREYFELSAKHGLSIREDDHGPELVDGASDEGDWPDYFGGD